MINGMRKMIKVYGIYLFVAFLVYISIDLFMYVQVSKTQKQVTELTEKMEGLDGVTLKCEEYEKQEDVPVCGFYDAGLKILRVKAVSREVYTQGCINPTGVGGILSFITVVRPGETFNNHFDRSDDITECESDHTNCVLVLLSQDRDGRDIDVYLSLPEPKCLRWGLTRG